MKLYLQDKNATNSKRLILIFIEKFYRLYNFLFLKYLFFFLSFLLCLRIDRIIRF